MAKKTAAKSIDSVSDLFNFLYEACNILRGPIGQDSFKEYVTPILYYKRISDVWDEVENPQETDPLIPHITDPR